MPGTTSAGAQTGRDKGRAREEVEREGRGVCNQPASGRQRDKQRMGEYGRGPDGDISSALEGGTISFEPFKYVEEPRLSKMSLLEPSPEGLLEQGRPWASLHSHSPAKLRVLPLLSGKRTLWLHGGKRCDAEGKAGPDPRLGRVGNGACPDPL